jgi:small subunit ribosomal protein S16
MLAIRLNRIGSKKRPTYRVVVTEARSPRDSRVLEALGYYNPKTQPATLKVNTERVSHWLKNGAQPSATVKSPLKKHKEPAAVAIATPTVAAQ